MTTAQLTEIAAAAVGAAQRQLPPELRPLARGVPVHYERTPAPDLLAEGFPADILGLFTGSAHGQELAHDQPGLFELAERLLRLLAVVAFAAGLVAGEREEDGDEQDDQAVHGQAVFAC